MVVNNIDRDCVYKNGLTSFQTHQGLTVHVVYQAYVTPSKCFPVFYTHLYSHASWESSFCISELTARAEPKYTVCVKFLFFLLTRIRIFPPSINRSIKHRWEFRRIQIRVESIFKLKFNWFLLFDWVWFFRCCQWPMTNAHSNVRMNEEKETATADWTRNLSTGKATGQAHQKLNERTPCIHVHRNTYDNMFIVRKSYKPWAKRKRVWLGEYILRWGEFSGDYVTKTTHWMAIAKQRAPHTRARARVCSPLHIRIAAFFPFLQCKTRDSVFDWYVLQIELKSKLKKTFSLSQQQQKTNRNKSLM